MVISTTVYQEALDTYLSLLEYASLMPKTQNTVLVVGTNSGEIGKRVSVSDILSYMNLNMLETNKELEIALEAEDAKFKERGMLLHELIQNELQVPYRSRHKLTALSDVIPRDKHGKPLENVKSKYHK